MGYALPAAMGATVARQDRPVVAVIGDGGDADHVRRAVKHMGACVGVVEIDYRIEDAAT